MNEIAIKGNFRRRGEGMELRDMVDEERMRPADVGDGLPDAIRLAGGIEGHGLEQWKMGEWK